MSHTVAQIISYSYPNNEASIANAILPRSIGAVHK